MQNEPYRKPTPDVMRNLIENELSIRLRYLLNTFKNLKNITSILCLHKKKEKTGICSFTMS